MSIEVVIREEAIKIAAREHSRADHLYEEYKRVQAQANSLKADHDMARSAPDRLLSFQPRVNGDYQCPACWIEENTVATMLPGFSASEDDFLECVKGRDRIAVPH